MALNSPSPTVTPLYQLQKTPEAVDSPTVKYPLLYQVTKDGKTHHVLGIAHPIPLDYMPDFVRTVISECHTLLTESLVYLPEEDKNKLIKNEKYYHQLENSFWNFIDEHNKEKLKQDFIPILKHRGINETNLENISGSFISHLFECCIKRSIAPGKLPIDENLIHMFKAANKPIIELNKDLDFKALIQHYIQEEDSLQHKLSLDPFDEDVVYLIDEARKKLMKLADTINDYYNFPEKQLKKDNHIQKLYTQFMEQDLDSETYKEEVKRKLKEHFLFTKVLPCSENKTWFTIFKQQHDSGKDGLLLACGTDHLFNGETSILDLLKQNGFSVTRVTHSDALINEVKFLSLSLC